MDSIFHRASVRDYLDKEIEPDKLERLLRAAMAAPSTANQQPWEFYVVTNGPAKAALAAAHPYAGPAAKAPAVIVPCFRRDAAHANGVLLDLSAATQNLLLEADALGLGAVWLGIAPVEERMERVRDVLRLPQRLEAFALVACGYPAREPAPKDRYDPARVHTVR